MIALDGATRELRLLIAPPDGLTLRGIPPARLVYEGVQGVARAHALRRDHLLGVAAQL